MAGAEDYGKAVAEFWTQGSRSLLAAQEGMMRAIREGSAGLKAAAPPATGTSAVGTPETGTSAPGVPASTAGAAPGTGTEHSAAAPFPDMARAMEAMTALWSSALGMSATLAGSLPTSGAEGEGTVAATLRRMMDPRAWLSAGDGVDEALQRLAEGPRLADAGDAERRFAKVSRAWLALRQRSIEHQGVVLEGWMRAGRDFAEQVARLNAAERGEAGPSPRRMLDLWVETANRALLETQRSEAFLRGQAALLRASTDLRFAQRDVAEHYAESFGLPTRRELDDVHRSVTEMRRELRALQRRARAEAAPDRTSDRLSSPGVAERPADVAAPAGAAGAGTPLDTRKQPRSAGAGKRPMSGKTAGGGEVIRVAAPAADAGATPARRGARRESKGS